MLSRVFGVLARSSASNARCLIQQSAALSALPSRRTFVTSSILRHNNDFDDYDPNYRRKNYSSNDYDRQSSNRNQYGNRSQFGGNRNQYGNQFGNQFGNRSQRNTQYSDFSNLQVPNWDAIELKPFEKNFYEPNEVTLNRSASEIQEYRKANNITISKTAPNPVLGFDELNFPESISKVIESHNFDKLTPIQAQGWPIALSGKNIVGIAQTG